ncbi:MAG: serine racemase VanT catalytic subunit, partial [Clostridiales bacterium]|nr:serine racemase VanT catalytic subunit [Clostridiales bacterium]
VGKICMDQLAVDVTDIPNVKTGSIATLIGKDGKEEITAPMVAESAESITNELLSRMGHRLNIIRRA